MRDKAEMGIAWLQSRTRAASSQGDRQFGTFAGVFTPTILTILGSIMYLREGWVVGNAGLGGALIIIGLAHVITIATGLSVSSITTNTRVGAGGAFAIISQSLGLEIGGSVGLPLYLAQGVSVTLYVLAFGEGFISIFAPESAPPLWLVSLIIYGLVVVIAYVSAHFAARIQFFIIGAIGLSLVFSQQLLAETNASCAFVRDSGEESALA